MNPSENEFDESLLTAYLDNEISSQERELVEMQLKTSAASRQLLSELQSIRSLLQKMPLPTTQIPIGNRPWNTGHESVSNDSITDLRPVIRPPQESDWTIPWRPLLSLAAVLAIAVTGGLYWSNALRPRTESLSMSIGKSSVSEINPMESQSASDSILFPQKIAPREVEDTPAVTPSGASLAIEQKVADADSAIDAAAVKETLRNSALPQARKKQDPSLARSSPSPAPAPAALSEGIPGGYGATGQRAMNRLPALGESNKLMEPGQPELNKYFQGEGAMKTKSADALDRTAFEWVARDVADEVDSADKKFLFRFQRAGTTQSFEKATQKDLGRVDLKRRDSPPSIPSFVEFEIPTADWQPAANRLQQIGIPVPNQPPNVGVLLLDAAVVAVPSQVDKSKTESTLVDGAVSNQVPWLFQLSKQDELALRSQLSQKIPRESEAENKTDVIRVQIRVAPTRP